MALNVPEDDDGNIGRRVQHQTLDLDSELFVAVAHGSILGAGNRQVKDIERRRPGAPKGRPEGRKAQAGTGTETRRPRRLCGRAASTWTRVTLPSGAGSSPIEKWITRWQGV